MTVARVKIEGDRDARRPASMRMFVWILSFFSISFFSFCLVNECFGLQKNFKPYTMVGQRRKRQTFSFLFFCCIFSFHFVSLFFPIHIRFLSIFFFSLLLSYMLLVDFFLSLKFSIRAPCFSMISRPNGFSANQLMNIFFCEEWPSMSSIALPHSVIILTVPSYESISKREIAFRWYSIIWIT